MKVAEIFEGLKTGKCARRPRILAFGSSNTQRHTVGMHWFDCFELAVYETYALPRCINSGVGGDSTKKLLDRFEEEAALFKPDMTFLTVGGNDSFTRNNVSFEEFKTNLLELHRRFSEMDCPVVFQTYYSPNPETPEANEIDRFYKVMDIVRDVAKETGSDLIDHLARWEPFRKKFKAEYESLMRDGFHVNEIGNMVIGLDIARHFGLKLGENRPDYWRVARLYQRLMDVAGGI